MTTILTKSVKGGTVDVTVTLNGGILEVTMEGKTVRDSAVVMPAVTAPDGTIYRHIMQESKVVLTAAEYQTIKDAERAHMVATYTPRPMSAMDIFVDELKRAERAMDRADSHL